MKRAASIEDRYWTLLAALQALEVEMRGEWTAPPAATYWADRLAALLKEHGA